LGIVVKRRHRRTLSGKCLARAWDRSTQQSAAFSVESAKKTPETDHVRPIPT
jgi:hypothetical protein